MNARVCTNKWVCVLLTERIDASVCKTNIVRYCTFGKWNWQRLDVTVGHWRIDRKISMWYLIVMHLFLLNKSNSFAIAYRRTQHTHSTHKYYHFNKINNLLNSSFRKTTWEKQQKAKENEKFIRMEWKEKKRKIGRNCAIDIWMHSIISAHR